VLHKGLFNGDLQSQKARNGIIISCLKADCARLIVRRQHAVVESESVVNLVVIARKFNG